MTTDQVSSRALADGGGSGLSLRPNAAEPTRSRLGWWRAALFRLLLRADARAAAANGIPAEQLHHIDVPIEL